LQSHHDVRAARRGQRYVAGQTAADDAGRRLGRHLDINATDNQGEVIQAAREQCREHLRAGRDFAFNATNITRQIRQRWIELFADYGAYIEIVYLEPPVGTILAQNRQRVKSVPEKVMLRLLERLEPPTVTECHSLILE